MIQKNKIVIRIKKEDTQTRPRSDIKPTKVHKSKTGYQRKPKHKKREIGSR